MTVIFRLLLAGSCLMLVVMTTGFLRGQSKPVGAALSILSGKTVARGRSPEPDKWAHGPTRPTLSLSSTMSDSNVKGAASQEGLWRPLDKQSLPKAAQENKVLPKFYRTMKLNQAARAEILRQAPLEHTKAAAEALVLISLPMPNGTFGRFRIEESPIMEPALAARFPEIKTYRGKGIDDPYATARFDWTPTGLHAIILSSQGAIFIEPYTKGDNGTYINYYKRDLPEDADTFQCSITEEKEAAARMPNEQSKASALTASLVSSGTILRTYRLAVAATAEYTQVYGGGTVGGALAAVTTTINLVNAIYERDLAIRLILVANETDVIFTNAVTDGYTSDNVGAMYNQNQSILDTVIGRANYDIGHVLDGHVFNFTPGHYFFQGRGELASVCANGLKAKGVTILRSLEPSSTSAVYTVAHEMGHQFGANHTFNGTTTSDCSNGRTAATAYEPGTGSTIMGYRGTVGTETDYIPICGGEDLHSTDTYFHAASIEQIYNFTNTGGGSGCAGQIATGNNPPTVSAGPNYIIPQSTPFTLTASGIDADNDALTYCWEQYDLGPPAPPNTDDGFRPIFRSFAPTANPSRTFPQLSDILSGVQTFGESLPVRTRNLNFRVTVRDNRSGSGGTGASSMLVNSIAGSGPFTVTQPASMTVWTGGSAQTVTWNVANTSNAPVNCPQVRILLSFDGGNTFPLILAPVAPNNGAATVNVPNIPTSKARVKVEAIGNIFFNISPANFTINASSNTTSPVLLTEANSIRAIALDSVTMVRDPFPIFTTNNFSLDQRTRVILFAVNLELLPGEDATAVTAEAEDALHRVYPLKVEYVGKVPGFDWLTQIIVRLPDSLGGSGDVGVIINWRGAASNRVLLGIK